MVLGTEVTFIYNPGAKRRGHLLGSEQDTREVVLMSLKDKYAIVGIGYTDQGQVPGRTALSFYIEVCANAIKGAGVSREEIDGLICYRHFPPAPGEREVTPYILSQHLYLTPKYLSQEANCARLNLDGCFKVKSISCWLEMERF